MAASLDVEAGLHNELACDPDLAAAAARNGVALRDLRAVPEYLELPLGHAHRRPGVQVVQTVGSDCAIGKMSVALEVDATARARGLGSCFVPTGQTGVAIAGWGIAVDHVKSDFVAGAAESLVDQGAARGDRSSSSSRGRGPFPIPRTRASLSSCCTGVRPTRSRTRRAFPATRLHASAPIGCSTRCFLRSRARRKPRAQRGRANGLLRAGRKPPRCHGLVSAAPSQARGCGRARS